MIDIIAPAASRVFDWAVALLGAHRAMYLFLPQLLGLVCLRFLLRELASQSPFWRSRAEVATWWVLAASIGAFLWVSPLAHHRPLTHQGCETCNTPAPVVARRD